ncbi:delta-lactam-biosynthetic de-N-acetylase [Metabacillus litoralis]|uniref:delta-lactam-biosynthetic de-N-acetylase n=1 Tax=Metabacillus litoralis TaxID=152268 RepID=UPI00203C0866|nr:delta-lactam-biosynthetic de-N-acetylase [Metabacillus litoralis]MCM3653919.1 delta-lactam-biosynthetic de-N-acetylase [Metabacillus litoralis]
MKKCAIVLSILCLFFLSMSPVYAQSNKPLHWGFAKSKNHEPPSAGVELDTLLGKYGSFYLGNSTTKEIYLTFDNGYENGYTPKVLDVLKKQKVPATFFVTGHYLEKEPGLVKRMVNEGHIVGNHSWHHPDLTTQSAEKLKKELESVRLKVEELTGQKEMNYLRPPRGIFSERVLAESKKLGYTTVFWSLAFIDWKVDAQRGWKYSYDNIMRQIHPGSILLLHTVSKDNAEALDQAIIDLKKEGYIFKSLDDMMINKMIENPYLISL